MNSLVSPPNKDSTPTYLSRDLYSGFSVPGQSGNGTQGFLLHATRHFVPIMVPVNPNGPRDYHWILLHTDASVKHFTLISF